VNASKVRAQLFQQADNYDLDAANELISTYKELRTVRQKQVDVAETAARTKTLNAVAVDTGGSGESTQKIYRRADLIRLKMRDPSKYESMNDEILEAYRTGRVK
jgi:phage terminase large subunit GpA-like protein